MTLAFRSAGIVVALVVVGCASRTHDGWARTNSHRPSTGVESSTTGEVGEKRQSVAPAPRQGSREAWWSLRQGMTQGDVLQLLGEPRSKSVYGASRHEVWWYEAPARVGFEPIGGKVVDWHTPDF